MKIEDILASWEYNPDSPPKICDSYCFSATWKGKDMPLKVALFEFGPYGNNRYLAFRLEDDDASWTLGRRNTYGTQTFPSRFSPTAEVVEQMVWHAIEDNLLHRQFVLKWEQTPRSFWTATLCQSGNGYWTHHLKNKMPEQRARFRFPVENFFESNAEIWRNKLLEELKNRDSDAVFARRFYLLENSAREERLQGTASSAEAKKAFEVLNSLWKLALLSCDENAEIYPYPVEMPFSVRLEIREKVLRGAPSRLKAIPYSRNKRSRRWAKIIARYGPSPFDFNNLKNTALRDFLQLAGYRIEASVEPTTFHEQLEANLKLLEWAKTHLPSKKYAEIEALES